MINLPVREGVEFKHIPSAPGFAAGSDGSVWSSKTGRWTELAQWQDHQGYRKANISKARKYVHLLVLEAFIGKPDPGLQGRHLNDVKSDNRIDNLKYGTPKENTEDRRKNDPMFSDSARYRNKLDEATVSQIRSDRAGGKPVLLIAKEYGIHPTTAWSIISRRSWKNVG